MIAQKVHLVKVILITFYLIARSLGISSIVRLVFNSVLSKLRFDLLCLKVCPHEEHLSAQITYPSQLIVSAIFLMKLGRSISLRDTI